MATGLFTLHLLQSLSNHSSNSWQTQQRPPHSPCNSNELQNFRDGRRAPKTGNTWSNMFLFLSEHEQTTTKLVMDPRLLNQRGHGLDVPKHESLKHWMTTWQIAERIFVLQVQNVPAGTIYIFATVTRTDLVTKYFSSESTTSFGWQSTRPLHATTLTCTDTPQKPQDTNVV